MCGMPAHDVAYLHVQQRFEWCRAHKVGQLLEHRQMVRVPLGALFVAGLRSGQTNGEAQAVFQRLERPNGVL